VLFLAQPGLRLSVCLQWLWTLVTRQRGSRLIVKPGKPGTLAQPSEVVPQAAGTVR
jgi:hypothetical protein